MQISGTCQIEISGESASKLDETKLRELKNKLTEDFSSVLDALLWEKYGVDNNEMHSCIVDDLTVNG